MRHVRLCCCEVLLLSALAHGTATAQNQNTGGVDGFVVNSITRAAIPGAHVALHCMQTTGAIACAPIMNAIAGAGGEFHFDAVAPGTYLLIAYSEAYLQQGVTPTVAVRAGERSTRIEVALTPASSIAGTVAVRKGARSREKVQVVAFKQMRTAGRRTFQAVGSSALDAAGHFRIRGLASGKYFIAAVEETRVEQAGEAAPALHAITFYGGGSDIRDAAPVWLAAGEENENVLIRPDERPLHLIAGRIDSVADAAEGESLSLEIAPLPGSAFETRIPVARDGQFQIVVASGSYVLRLTSTKWDPEIPNRPRSGRRRLLAQQRIEVGRRDITELQIVPAADVRISGEILAEGDELRAELGDMQLSLQPIRQSGYLATSEETRVDKDGSFVFPICEPVAYSVSAALPPDTYIASVTFNDADASGGIIDVSSGAGGTLRISLRKGAARIAGSVHEDERAAQASDTQAVLIPEAFDANPDAIAPVVHTSVRKGQFQFQNLRPGVYQVAVVDSFRSGAWDEVEFLRQVAQRASTVTVQRGETANVRPMRISVDEIEQMLRFLE